MKDLLTPDLEQEILAIRRRLHQVEEEWKLQKANHWVFEPFSAAATPGPHRREASGGSAPRQRGTASAGLHVCTFCMGFVLGIIFAVIVANWR